MRTLRKGACVSSWGYGESVRGAGASRGQRMEGNGTAGGAPKGTHRRQAGTAHPVRRETRTADDRVSDCAQGRRGGQLLAWRRSRGRRHQVAGLSVTRISRSHRPEQRQLAWRLDLSAARAPTHPPPPPFPSPPPSPFHAQDACHISRSAHPPADDPSWTLRWHPAPRAAAVRPPTGPANRGRAAVAAAGWPWHPP